MRTYARAGRRLSAHSGRAVCFSIATLIAFGVAIPLTGCGSSNKGSLGTVKPATSRKQGSVTMTVVWPARTRLIPAAANSIQITLTHVPDTQLPNPKVVPPQLLTRPAEGQPLTTTTVFSNLEIGTYTITATAYPSATGPGTPNPATGDNVPVATKTAGSIVVNAGNQNTSITMDTTIAQLAPDLPVDFPRNTDGNIILLPGQQVQFNTVAFDATPATATPAGPYRVIFSKSKLQYEVTQQDGVTVTVDKNTGLVTAGTLTDPTVVGTATIKVTETESGKSSEISIVVSPAGLSQVAQWARFRGNSQNTGQAPFATALKTDQSFWKLSTGSQIEFASPVIAENGTVYIGTKSKDPEAGGPSANDKKLYAIDTNGVAKWTFSDGGNLGDIEGSVTIGQDGTLYFGSMNGYVYALRDTPDTVKGTGYTVVWKKKVGAGDDVVRPVFGSVAISSNNTLYVATDAAASEVHAISGFTGDPIKVKQADGTTRNWVFSQATGGIQTAPALSTDGSTVFVGTLDGGIYAIQTGTRVVGKDANGNDVREEAAVGRWQANLNSSSIIASPVVTRVSGVDVVIVATLGGKVFALKTDAGGSFWTNPYDANAPIYTTPAVFANTSGAQSIFIGTLDNTSGTNDHKVVSIGASDGKEQWRTVELTADGAAFFSDGFTSSPAVTSDGGRLYIGSLNGNVYAIDTVTDVGSGRRGLVQLPAGGDTTRDWTFSTPAASGSQVANQLESSPALDKSGRVYIGGFNGDVYAIGQ